MARLGWQHVLITGASSGLGRALALACAAPGVTLHLGGRDATRLAETAAALAGSGATVLPRVVDVRDEAAMAAWVGGVGRLDLVIANAGIAAGTGEARAEPPEAMPAIFATNLGGVLHTCLPALAVMRAQSPGADGVRGRIAVVSSIAAFVAAPGGAAYCASKAAVQRWVEAMDGAWAGQGVRFHAICPGYVRTPMTDRNRFPMPWLMEAGEAARRSLAGIAAGRARIIYPWPLYAIARLVGALPPRLRNALLNRAAG